MKISGQTPVQRSFTFPSTGDVSTSDQSSQVRPSELPEVGPDNDKSGGNESEETSNQGQESDRSDQSNSDNQGNSENKNNGSRLPFVNRPPGLTQQESEGSGDGAEGEIPRNIEARAFRGSSGNSLVPDSSPGNQGQSSNGFERTAESDQGVGESGDAEGPFGLTPGERKRVEELKRIDRKVRAHEQAHLAAAGPYAQGGPSYEYTQGPDGKRYAVGGEVSLDTSKQDNPRETIKKMQAVRSAALAPADPSPQDQQVANQASQKLSEAKRKQARQEREGAGNEEGVQGEQAANQADEARPAEESGNQETGGTNETEGPSSDRDQPGEAGDATNDFEDQNGNSNQTGGIEFAEDFGDALGEANQENGEVTNENDDTNSPFEIVGEQNADPGEPGEARGRSDSPDAVSSDDNGRGGADESESEQDDDSGLPEFLTREATRQERRTFPGQQVNLVI